MTGSKIPKSGIFVTLEGGDGAGKSTLSKGLVNALAELGVSSIATREPGGAPLAEQIRKLILDAENTHQWSPMSEALLMNAARREHLRTTILPALAEGKWVICDRFMDSTRAYQARVSNDMLEMLEKQVVGRRPDITLLLDAAPEDLLGRRDSNATEKDRFEQRALPYHRYVRAQFLALAEKEPERIKTISATLPAADVLNAALKQLQPFMKVNA